ncbi:MAG: hypothetical protein WA956_02990 [Stenotrophomonas sp.]
MTEITAKIGRGNSSNSGRVQHFHLDDAKGGVLSELPSPFSLSIVKGDDGFFLLRKDEAGHCISDTWHFCLEDAKRQAMFEFSIGESDWVEGE